MIKFCANTHAHTRRGGAAIRKRVLYKPAQIRAFISMTITRRLQEGFGKRNMPGKRAGWSTCHVARQVDRSEFAVRNCWEHWTREGTHARKTGSRVTRKTTRREVRRIVRQALLDPTVTQSTIRADIGVAIVPQTIS
ncbi:transposable element Tc1 transposase [Trichonephila clavipes]|nr:transposable element Tc1 transposase [Trichonephila clavipes]